MATTRKRFAVGDQVRLTGEFLRNTGQYTGSAGLDRWLVRACPCPLCADGTFIATNEKKTPEEIRQLQRDYDLSEDDPRLDAISWRHIHAGNLERVRVYRPAGALA